jgi:ABC-type thiamine transport system ATPase subunit
MGQTAEMNKPKTSRDTATPISRPVYMLFRSFNLHPVIDARPR